MEKGKIAVDGENAGGSRLFLICLALAVALFCSSAGESLSGDSTSMSGDISGYTGRASSEQPGGGSYLQMYSSRRMECTRANTRTNTCSCPAGYGAQLVALAEGPSCDWEPCWVTYGYVCEK